MYDDDDDDIIDAEFETDELAIEAVDPDTDMLVASIPMEGYYICIKDPKSSTKNPPRVGDLVYLLEVSNGQPQYLHRNAKWWDATVEEFLEHFTFEPNGEVLRQQSIQEGMMCIADLNADALHLADLLSTFRPHIGVGGALEGTEIDPNGSTALALEKGTPLAAKRSIAKVRNEMQKLNNSIAERMSDIQAMMHEQAAILASKVKSLEPFIKAAEEAIWTINLYMGKDEEITVLSKGDPEPADEPICLRQKVLYMDEECAIDPIKGGIDALSIDLFDKWLLADPKHLEWIIPERKALVALKVRRRDKSYDNHAQAIAMAEANRKTYFLCRNGDNLYRMWIDYETTSVLFPTTNEFAPSDKQQALEPGSEAWMELEKRVSGKRRHYMRFSLILQGLLDRTTIYHPIDGRTNVADWRSYIDGGPIRAINDAENLLPDGRERFDDWMARINGALEPGMRVAGSWESLNGFRDRDTWKNSRLTPPGAYLPDSGIYPIEGKRGSGFYFLYERTDKKYVRYEGEVEFKKKASCQIMPTDRFILNIDAATLDEMEFYLHSRADRSSYIQMIPLLKEALGVKRAEEEAEAPFKRMLVGHLNARFRVDFDDAEAEVAELAPWWKFKNKTHRSLLVDDKAALEQIVTEYQLRVKERRRRSQLKAAGFYENFTAKVVAANTQPVLLIAHKTGMEFTVLVEADNRETFVHEQIWYAGQNGFELRETREWRTVDRRFTRWDVVYTSERWAGWHKGVNRWSNLSDPEAEALAYAMAEAEEAKPPSRHYNSRTGDYDDDIKPFPLGLVLDDKNMPHLYLLGKQGKIRTEDLLSHPASDPTIYHLEGRWQRGANRVPELVPRSKGCLSYHWHPENTRKTARAINAQGFPCSMPGGRLLRSWPENIALLDEFDRRLAEYEAARDPLYDKAWGAYNQIGKAYCKKIELRVFDAFIKEFGDPELWEGHKKTLKQGTIPTDGRSDALQAVIFRVVERGHEISGLTVGQIFDIYKTEPPADNDPQGEVKETGYYGSRKLNPKFVEIPEDYLDLVVE